MLWKRWCFGSISDKKTCFFWIFVLGFPYLFNNLLSTFLWGNYPSWQRLERLSCPPFHFVNVPFLPQFLKPFSPNNIPMPYHVFFHWPSTSQLFITNFTRNKWDLQCVIFLNMLFKWFLILKRLRGVTNVTLDIFHSSGTVCVLDMFIQQVFACKIFVTLWTPEFSILLMIMCTNHMRVISCLIISCIITFLLRASIQEFLEMNVLDMFL